MKLPKWVPTPWKALETVHIGLAEGFKSAKHRHSLTVPALYVHEDGFTEEYSAVVDPGQNVVHVPALQRQWSSLFPLRFKGRDLYIISKNNISTVNVPYLHKIAKGITRDVKYQLKFDEFQERIWSSQWDKFNPEHKGLFKPGGVLEVIVSSAPATIDPRAMDLMKEDLAISFQNQSWKVSSTKALEFLDPVPRMTIIWTALLSACFGLISGGVLGFIANLLLLALKK